MSTLKINDRAMNFANALEGKITIDEKGVGNIDTKVAEEILSSGLPEGMTLAAIKEAHDISIDWANAQTLEFGKASIKAFENDANLQSTSLRTRHGLASVDTSVQRVRSGGTEGGSIKPWRKYGTTSTSINLGTGRRSSDNKNIVAYLQETAASKFQS